MLYDDLDECGGSGRERIYVCIWLIHDVIQQNLTHIAKQLHSSKKKKKRKEKQQKVMIQKMRIIFIRDAN